MDQLDPGDFEGKWTLVADSMKITQSFSSFQQSNSTSIDFYNSTVIKTQRFGESCIHFAQHISIEGHQFNIKFGKMSNLSGTFYKTTCADCVVMSSNMDSPNYKMEELRLFSKRREVDQKELKEFAAQVECLKLPKPVVLNPLTELCPVHHEGHTAPLTCEDLIQPLDQLDPRELEGSWALVADSLKVIQSEVSTQLSDSTSIDFYNSTFIKTQRIGLSCYHFAQDVSIEGANYNFKVGGISSFSGTFYKTTCADCVVLSFNEDSPNYKSEELCLFSKRREVDQRVLREFAAQVKCLKMPKPVVMDPSVELCPSRRHLSSSA